MSLNYNFIWLLCYLLVLVGLAGYGFHRLSIVYLYWKNRNNKPQPKARFQELPVVTVQLPMFNEKFVVDRLLESVAALDYPQDRLEIQILDDSTDDTTEQCYRKVEELKSRGFDAVCIHRTDRTGFKAGALEAATKVAKGEFLLILDADFVPEPDLLQKTIHFFTDENVGLVQTRWGHINREYNLLTRIQGMYLDGHFAMEQTARNRSGRFFTFNGTAGIWRKCVIGDAGGWSHDTLTEDMDLSYRVQLKGWRFIYLNDVVTPAELPVDMDGFKSQQHRWTKGSIQVCQKILLDIWRSNAPLKAKVEATTHLTCNYSYLLLALLCFLVYPIGLHVVCECGPVFHDQRGRLHLLHERPNRGASQILVEGTAVPPPPSHTERGHGGQQRQGCSGSHLRPSVRLRPHAQIRRGPEGRPPARLPAQTQRVPGH